jgi:hypothetical protein
MTIYCMCGCLGLTKPSHFIEIIAHVSIDVFGLFCKGCYGSGLSFFAHSVSAMLPLFSVVPRTICLAQDPSVLGIGNMFTDYLIYSMELW